MSTHALNASKGWPSPSALDASYKASANVLYDLTPGQVCHQNSAGELEPGVIALQMPFFLFGGSASLDVMNTPGTTWWPVVPRGRIGCFPGLAPMEFWTTEFDTTQNYLPNQFLRAPIGNAAIDVHGGGGLESGRLTNQGVIYISDTIASQSSKYTAICGVAIIPSSPNIRQGGTAPTTPKFTNINNVSILCFYPVYLPGHPTQSV
jgi:hypothetical protein